MPSGQTGGQMRKETWEAWIYLLLISVLLFADLGRRCEDFQAREMAGWESRTEKRTRVYSIWIGYDTHTKMPFFIVFCLKKRFGTSKKWTLHRQSHILQNSKFRLLSLHIWESYFTINIFDLKHFPSQKLWYTSSLIGRRACIGEQLARTELLIDTVALLQNFTFRAEDPENPPKVAGKMAFSYVPHPFKIVPVPI